MGLPRNSIPIKGLNLPLLWLAVCWMNWGSWFSSHIRKIIRVIRWNASTKLCQKPASRGGSPVNIGVGTAVMLYNASVHSSLGQTPNQLWLGYDFRDNPADLVLGRPALGPADGEPLELAAKLRQEIELVVKVANENMSLAIHGMHGTTRTESWTLDQGTWSLLLLNWEGTRPLTANSAWNGVALLISGYSRENHGPYRNHASSKGDYPMESQNLHPPSYQVTVLPGQMTGWKPKPLNPPASRMYSLYTWNGGHLTGWPWKLWAVPRSDRSGSPPPLPPPHNPATDMGYPSRRWDHG